jgi:GTP-binding protein
MKQQSVVIVGRMNVGKSTLFNRLSHDARSLTLNYAGVTRDIIKGQCTWRDHTFTLIDTGGISIQISKDPILQQVRTRAMEAINTAFVLLFVVDGTVGVTTEDLALAKVLRAYGKHVIVVVNKGDTKVAQDNVHEFLRLGYGDPILISAQHNSNINSLLDAILAYQPMDEYSVDPAEQPLRVALIGKPNVGKSSLMNLLLKQERSIVADIPGTTREAITEQVSFSQQDLLLSDTAGIRRKRSVEEPIEKLMVSSTLRALDDADIILLVVDGSQGTLSDQELKLAFYVFEQKHKGLIIVFNKDDIATEYADQMLIMDKEKYAYFLEKIITVTISCKTGKNVTKIAPLINQVWQNYCQKFDADGLTAFIKEAFIKKPLYVNSKLLIVRRVEQVGTRPITLLLIVNEPKWFGPTHIGFIDNMLRKEYDLRGIPIKFLVRKSR